VPGVQVGVGYVDIKPDLSGFSRDLKTKVGQDMVVAGDQGGKKLGGSLASSFSTTIKGVAAGIGAAFIARFIGDAIGQASDLSESVNKSNQVFGSSATIISSWAEGAAKSIGLPKQAAFEAAGTFGNMFAQLGIGTDQAAQLSMGVVDLAADLASFHNADISDVILAQSAAFRGEYDSVQRYLPLINAATVEQRALQITGKQTTKELTAQDKALAVHRMMVEGAGDATGDFERTSDGLANQQRIMTAEWSNAKTELGEGLLPLMVALAGVVNDELIPAFKTLFLSSGADATGWAADLRDVIGDTVGFLLGVFAEFGRLVANFASALPGTEDFVRDLRAGADAADEGRVKLHASTAELLSWRAAAEGGGDAAAALSGDIRTAAGATKEMTAATKEGEKAARDAADAHRDWKSAQRDLAELLRKGAVDEEKVADARRSLADATRSLASANRTLADVQEDYDEALAAANILGTDTALEELEDASDNLADAKDGVASAAEREAEAQKALREAQAGDPDFQDKLADARDRVADAQDKVTTAETKTVAQTPAVVAALGARKAEVKALADEVAGLNQQVAINRGLGDVGDLYVMRPGETPEQYRERLVGKGVPTAGIDQSLAGTGWSGVPTPETHPYVMQPGETAEQYLARTAPAPTTTTTTNNITVNVTEPVQDPALIGKAIAWVI
jgi:hypothetical protein